MANIVPNPIGRPTIYEEKFCQMLIDHMAEGMSMESFGGMIGVSRQSLHTWTKKHAEFLYAKQVGISKSQLWWEKAGRQGMFKGGFSSSVWIFSMKNKFGWQDRHEGHEDKVIHTVKIQLPGQGTEQQISIGPNDENEDEAQEQEAILVSENQEEEKE